MYFLALLLTLRVAEATRNGMLLEDADASSALLQAIHDKVTCVREDYLRVALLGNHQEHVIARLTCISGGGGSLGAGVLQALAPGCVLQCAEYRYEVESVDLTDPMWTGISAWPDMLSQPGGTRLRFAFATPLVTSNPAREQFGNALPFPDPQVLFASALRHWRMLDGPPLPFVGEQVAQAARCLVSEYHLETDERVLAGRSYLGFLGWIEYTCRASEVDAVASLNALARLAFFTGCGYLTEYGMGTTTVRIAK